MALLLVIFSVVIEISRADPCADICSRDGPVICTGGSWLKPGGICHAYILLPDGRRCYHSSVTSSWCKGSPMKVIEGLASLQRECTTTSFPAASRSRVEKDKAGTRTTSPIPREMTRAFGRTASRSENRKDPERSLSVLTFGDFGKPSNMMKQTMRTLHRKFPTPDMVWLLGDNSYKRLDSPSEFQSLFDIIAAKSSIPFFAIMGNRDYDRNAAESILEFTDPRWFIDAKTWYMRKFSLGSSRRVVCVWFLNTAKFDREQREWLNESLEAEKSGCAWTIVNGHHPGRVHASGSKFSSGFIDRLLQPILDTHEVDVYLCGHYHNSQHVINPPHRTNVFIVGHIADTHSVSGVPDKGVALWVDDKESAFLHLEISDYKIDFSFHGGTRALESPPLYGGTIASRHFV
jgi:hypothetical protein